MYQNFIKRTLDISLALVLLIVTSPISIIVGILIKRESPGPIFFRQNRTGRHGQPFKMYKFRSMTHGNNVRDLTKQDEPTRIGVIMRRLSIDEIPQLINVLHGDMSFIGPRPWIPEYYEHMTKRQRQRNDVRPGITGLAQAYGRNSLTIKQKIKYDLEYVHDISFKEDVKIIFITLKTMFDKSTNEMGKGAIHGELDILKQQHIEDSTQESFKSQQYS
jgi:lipopolysaccharide/colanic/teichoic acid biosynthesis glycosyltransferase